MFKVGIHLLVVLGLAVSATASADPSAMRHNMVLFGENEIFASHIVYKVPHNYQVILALSLDAESLQKYQAAKVAQPTAQFIYLLDPMHIEDIDSQSAISGTVFFIDANGQNHEVIHELTITRNNFKIIYFDELPLSLAQDPAPMTHLRMQLKSSKCSEEDAGRFPECAPPCPTGPIGKKQC